MAVSDAITVMRAGTTVHRMTTVDTRPAEIAHAMHLSDGAVKYHLHAARASLRAAMEPQS